MDEDAWVFSITSFGITQMEVDIKVVIRPFPEPGRKNPGFFFIVHIVIACYNTAIRRPARQGLPALAALTSNRPSRIKSTYL